VSSSKGQLIAELELVHRIAIGGMAEVWEARHRWTGERAALKLVVGSAADDPALRQAMMDEIQIGGLLDHPNIVRLHSLTQENGAVGIKMDLVEGRDLRKLMGAAMKAKAGPPPIEGGLSLAHQCTAALAYAHEAKDRGGKPLGIIHRDISPQNVLVGRDGAVKLLDFGIALARDRVTQTKVGMVKGKLNYMSPEQIMGETLDVRTDLFALGVVLWETFAMRPLFARDRDDDTVRAIIAGEVARLRDLRPEVPEPIALLVHQLLEVRREARPATAREVLDVLDAFRGDRGALAAWAMPFQEPRHKTMALQAISRPSASQHVTLPPPPPKPTPPQHGGTPGPTVQDDGATSPAGSTSRPSLPAQNGAGAAGANGVGANGGPSNAGSSSAANPGADRRTGSAARVAPNTPVRVGSGGGQAPANRPSMEPAPSTTPGAPPRVRVPATAAPRPDPAANGAPAPTSPPSAPDDERYPSPERPVITWRPGVPDAVPTPPNGNTTGDTALPGRPDLDALTHVGDANTTGPTAPPAAPTAPPPAATPTDPAPNGGPQAVAAGGTDALDTTSKSLTPDLGDDAVGASDDDGFGAETRLDRVAVVRPDAPSMHTTPVHEDPTIGVPVLNLARPSLAVGPARVPPHVPPGARIGDAAVANTLVQPSAPSGAFAATFVRAPDESSPTDLDVGSTAASDVVVTTPPADPTVGLISPVLPPGPAPTPAPVAPSTLGARPPPMKLPPEPPTPLYARGWFLVLLFAAVLLGAAWLWVRSAR
jgi:serine/threonine protein kinase